MASLICLAIILIINIVIAIDSIHLDKKHQEAVESVIDMNTRLLIQKAKLISILAESKRTKENYFITLEKIEKELADKFDQGN